MKRIAPKDTWNGLFKTYDRYDYVGYTIYCDGVKGSFCPVASA